MISYLLHSSILLGGFALFYLVFLRRETFFLLHRWTFVLAIVISLLLPLVTVPASMSLRSPATTAELLPSQTEVLSEVIEAPATTGVTEIPTDPQKEKQAEQTTENLAPPTGFAAMSVADVLRWIYWFGVLVFAVLFIVQLTILLTKMYSLNGVKTGRYRIIELLKDEAPYSFWNTIFINPESYDPETYEQIIEHEKLHID
ncbi:MAG: hypothetical protein AAFO94_22785, partial [Bacteroidota bacterium]